MNITGKIIRNAEIRSTASGRQFVSFTLMVSESYKTKEGERKKQNSFFDCAYWITTNAVSLLTKGAVVTLNGRLNVNAWISAENKAKASLNFHISSFKVESFGEAADKPEFDMTRNEQAPAVLAEDLPF